MGDASECLANKLVIHQSAVQVPSAENRAKSRETNSEITRRTNWVCGWGRRVVTGFSRRRVGVMLTLSAFTLLVPGIVLPMLTIEASTSILGFSVELMNQTHSILQTVKALFDKGYTMVACLILLFSIIIPTFKAICLLLRLLHVSARSDGVLAFIIRLISKWSMADVFVMGIWVAFLSAQASGHLSAQLHEGFYFFLGYCLLSIAAVYCLDMPSRARVAVNSPIRSR
ncbi:MAG: paraquat-inducible protein A [Gammaproteobacteria bacterium]